MIARKNAGALLLAATTALALYICYLLLRPYATAILFASVVAIIFHPLHKKGTQKIFRSDNVSALVSTALTLAFTVVPATFLLLASSKELTGLYQSLTTSGGGTGSLLSVMLRSFETVVAWAGRHFPIPPIDLHGVLLRTLESTSGSVVRFGASLMSNAFWFIANAVIAVVILFFLYRDGERGLIKVMRALPVPEEQLLQLRQRVGSTVMANFYGGVAVGALQGTLTGLCFWALGLDSPILWGLVTALFSLIPLAGSALVWVPASVVLLLTGHFAKAVILFAAGIAVIGTVDNIVRPLIIGKTVRLHPLLVFLALLGGVRLFGVLGIFVGPVILSFTVALLMIVRDELANDHRSGALQENARMRVAARSKSTV